MMIMESNDMANDKTLVHYEGKCGNVDYDPEMFKISDGLLFLKKDYKGPIDLPKGCVDISYMFRGKDLTGCYFRDFDTSNVKRMAETFRGCALPEGFSLGNKFDTSNVETMEAMFNHCKFSKGFTLGDKFDTSNVTQMGGMFTGVEFPEGFSLGDKFDTSKVWNMDSMFWNCDFPDGFTLGDKFDTSNVRVINEIFARCKFRDGFSLGKNFNLSSAEVLHYMFRDSIYVKDGKEFYVKEDKDSKKMELVFEDCESMIPDEIDFDEPDEAEYGDMGDE